MARIGILNFPGHNNQGANLTAYALQQVLKNMGHQVTNMHLLMNYAQTKDARFTDFSDKNIDISPFAATGAATMCRYNRDFDTFIVGSDQVWRADNGLFSWKAKFDPCYWLAFAAPGKRRISVAASFGTDTFCASDCRKKAFGQELTRYTALSVREQTGKPIVEEACGRTPQVLVDPVFYLPEGAWDRFCIPPSANAHAGKIAYNAFFCSHILHQCAKQEPERFFNLLQGGTAQWLAGIRDARFVVTDSFHVACFCLIFNTPFMCMIPHDKGAARFHEMADVFGFDHDRVVDCHTVEEFMHALDKITNMPWDASRVQAAIGCERQRALAWLEQALVAPVPEWSGPAYSPGGWWARLRETLSNSQWRCRAKRLLLRRAFGFLLHVSPIGRQWLKGKHERQIKILQNLPW